LVVRAGGSSVILTTAAARV